MALHEAALAAIRTRDSYLQAQYQRLKPRLGHGRALGAVKHSMLVAYWHMFTTGETYHDLGGDYFHRRNPERATKRLIQKLEALGHHVTLQPAVPNTGGISHQEALVTHPLCAERGRDRLCADHAQGRSTTIDPHSLNAGRSPIPPSRSTETRVPRPPTGT